VALSAAGNKSSKSTLAYARPDADRVVLQGTLGSDAVAIRLRRIYTSKFLLVNRGFHWINELPFNR
jgi:hypothetical protein